MDSRRWKARPKRRLKARPNWRWQARPRPQTKGSSRLGSCLPKCVFFSFGGLPAPKDCLQIAFPIFQQIWRGFCFPHKLPRISSSCLLSRLYDAFCGVARLFWLHLAVVRLVKVRQIFPRNYHLTAKAPSVRRMIDDAPKLHATTDTCLASTAHRARVQKGGTLVVCGFQWFDVIRLSGMLPRSLWATCKQQNPIKASKAGSFAKYLWDVRVCLRVGRSVRSMGQLIKTKQNAEFEAGLFAVRGLYVRLTSRITPA